MALPTTTKAAVLLGHDQPLALMDLTIPPLKPGQVLVDIAFSGICHTQLGEVRGKRGPDRFIPHCLGHEGAGEVIAVGDDVTKVAVGDKVIISWVAGSGLNVPGMVYAEGYDQPINAGGCNTLMTYSCVSENRVTKIPADFPLDVAALIGCAIPTGAGTVIKKAQAKAGQSIAIFGSGGVGLSAMLAAAHIGCDPIIAVDVVPEKLAKMAEFGATHTINAGQEDPVEAIKALTDGQGVDIAIEAAGVPNAMVSAYNATKLNGGQAILLGNLPHGGKIEIDPFPLLLGRQLTGTGGTICQPDDDFPTFVAGYQDGTLAIDKLISHVLPLDQVNEAFDLVESGQAVRVVVDLRSKNS